MAVLTQALLVLWVALAVSGYPNPAEKKQGQQQPQGRTMTVGKNSQMCITFDKPLHTLHRVPKGTKKNFGAQVRKDCGLDGNCGLYKRPLEIDIPFFDTNKILDLSVSVWFKRQGGPGCWPLLTKKGNFRGGTIQINSIDDTHLTVTVRHCSGQTYQGIFNTDSQSSGWRHVAVTVHVGKVRQRDWVKVYIDGKKCDKILQSWIFLVRRLYRVSFPNFFRPQYCRPCRTWYYRGFVDSVSVARYVLRPREVRTLFKSRGLCIGLKDEFKGRSSCENTWVLIVAGSSGYNNYRHQADACHAYRVVRNRGVPEERIVLMMYDDIANNALNPDQGQIFNRLNGPNVYDVTIDYKGDNITAANFLDILRGNQAAMSGIGSGKVINSGPDDNVFVYYTNHGGPGVIGFPSGPVLSAPFLNSAILQMYNAFKFGQMVFYIDACFSGSMFNNLLPTGIRVYATTAASPTESSYAHYYSSHHSTYLGDEYSINWTEDSDIKDLQVETVQEQFLIVKANTQSSHVQEYGQLSVSNSPLADFQSWISCFGDGDKRLKKTTHHLLIDAATHREHQDSVASEDVPLAILRHKIAATAEGPSKALLTAQIKTIQQTRAAVRGVFASIVKQVGKDRGQLARILRAKHEISNFDCYIAAMELFNEKCFSVSQNQFAMLQLQILVNLCEDRVPKKTVLKSIAAVCHPGMNRSPFKDMAD